MPNVQAVVGFSGYQSAPVTVNHLGTNILFHNDSVSPGSDFNAVTDDIGIEFVRYPGGTIAEEYFDPANPNDSTTLNIVDVINGANNVRSQTVVTLSEFLAYNASATAPVAIVLPTFRYFDPTTGDASAAAEAEVKGFIRDLLTDVHGPVGEVVIELGNEWYQDRFGWTLQDFGQVQATLASWVDEEARALGLRDDVTLLAQAGRTFQENVELAAFFETPGQSTVDGVLTHLYGTNSTGNPLGIGGGIDTRLDDIDSAWGAVLGVDFELAVTEWNVGENGEATSLINGLMRLAPLMRIFGEMLSNGVDLGMIWSTQTNGPAGLSNREGLGSELSPTGYFYQMLLESLPGKSLVDTGQSFRLRDENGATVGYNYTFEGSGDVVSYFASGTDEAMALQVDLTAFQAADAYVYVTILGAAPGDTGIEYWSEASVRHLTAVDLQQGPNGEWFFDLPLGAYELAEVNLVVAGGVTISGDTQNAISDALVGSDYADTLAGHLGDDSLTGGAGDDTLLGGDGDDEIAGGRDHDSIEGGAGNDLLLGEHGRDFLDGGAGDDTLDGGAWHDTLLGGGGTDSIIGGAGNDFIELDAGFADGGAGTDTLSFAEQADGISVWTREAVVETASGQVAFEGIEVLTGSDHEDYFSVDSEGHRFEALGGDDVFHVMSGAGNTIDMGAGNDVAFIYFGHANQVSGGEGTDTIHAYSAGNQLSGGAGDDMIFLFSPGQDTVVFQAGHGSDRVLGFEAGLDVLELYGLDPANLVLTETAEGTELSFGAQGTILLEGTFGLDAADDLTFL